MNVRLCVGKSPENYILCPLGMNSAQVEVEEDATGEESVVLCLAEAHGVCQ